MNCLDILTGCIVEREDDAYTKLFSLILQQLYNCDLVEEDVIIDWFTKAEGNEVVHEVRMNVNLFFLVF